MTVAMIVPLTASNYLKQFREKRPLVHCLTNDVVQEITANVLLAAGASPAMVIAREEATDFVKIASALLVNVGTVTSERAEVMLSAAQAANECGVPWVLDPVAAGLLPWRDALIKRFLELRPTAVRANASEILAIMGMSAGGKGVDSLDSSDAALEAAQRLAREYGVIATVTGETDYATDGENTIAVQGGSALSTLVVGTGCSLSALVAGFLAVHPTVEAAASACFLAKLAASYARMRTANPGSFRMYYLDALHEMQPDNMLLRGSVNAKN